MISQKTPLSSRWRTGIDLALVVALLFALLAWFFDPWQITGDGFRLRVNWGVKPWVVIAVLLIARRWITQNMGSDPPAGCCRVSPSPSGSRYSP